MADTTQEQTECSLLSHSTHHSSGYGTTLCSVGKRIAASMQETWNTWGTESWMLRPSCGAFRYQSLSAPRALNSYIHNLKNFEFTDISAIRSHPKLRRMTWKLRRSLCDTTDWRRWQDFIIRRAMWIVVLYDVTLTENPSIGGFLIILVLPNVTQRRQLNNETV